MTQPDKTLWIYLEDKEDDANSLIEAIKKADLHPAPSVVWCKTVPEIIDLVRMIFLEVQNPTRWTKPGETTSIPVQNPSWGELKVPCFQQHKSLLVPSIECYVLDVELEDSTSYEGARELAGWFCLDPRNLITRPVFFLTRSLDAEAKPSHVGSKDKGIGLIVSSQAYVSKDSSLDMAGFFENTLGELGLSEEDVREIQREARADVFKTAVRTISERSKTDMELRRWLAEIDANVRGRTRVSFLFYGDPHYGEQSRRMPLHDVTGIGKKDTIAFTDHYLQTEFRENLTRIKDAKVGDFGNQNYHECFDIDGVVCVGDLLSRADVSYLDDFKTDDLPDLLETLSLKEWLYVFVPGNHDFRHIVCDRENKNTAKEEWFYKKLLAKSGKLPELELLTPRGIGLSKSKGRQLKGEEPRCIRDSRLTLKDVWFNGNQAQPVSFALFGVECGVGCRPLLIAALDIYGYTSGRARGITSEAIEKLRHPDDKISGSGAYRQDYSYKYHDVFRTAYSDMCADWTPDFKEDIASTIKLAILHQPFKIRCLEDKYQRHFTLGNQDPLLEALTELKFQGCLCGHVHVAHMEVLSSGDFFTAVSPSIAALDCADRLGYSVFSLDLPALKDQDSYVGIRQTVRHTDKWGIRYDSNNNVYLECHEIQLRT